MTRDKGFFRDAGPVILRLDSQARWSRMDAGQFRKVAALVAVLSVGLALITWGRVQVLANGYEIMDLQSQRDRLEGEHLRLERRIQDMQSLSYAETAARQRLGMVDINPNRVITLRRKSAAEHLADSLEAMFSRRKEARPPAGR